MKKNAGMQDTGQEARERFHLMLSTREQTRAETDSLFVHAKSARSQDRGKVQRLFKQAPAVVTMATNLQAEPPNEDLADTNDPNAPCPLYGCAKSASVAPHVDEWFEKNADAFLTTAQRRYPELLKFSASPAKVPISASRTKTPVAPIPTQHALSGGSA